MSDEVGSQTAEVLEKSRKRRSRGFQLDSFLKEFRCEGDKRYRMLSFSSDRINRGFFKDADVGMFVGSRKRASS